MKHVLMSLMLIGSVSILGCRSSETKTPATGEGTTTAPADGPTTKKLTIGISIPSADHGWTGGVGWWAEQTIKQYPNVQWKLVRADKPETQIDQVRDMMAQSKLDGMVILCTESAPLTPIAREIKANGIFLVNVDRGFLEPVADVFLEGDNKAFGRKSAEFMAEKLGGKGNIVVLRGIPSTVDSDRVDAAMEVFRKHPDIKILGTQPGYWNRDKGLEVMKTFLTQHPKIDAVWAQDDDMAEGAEQAIKEAGRAKGMWMLGGAGKKTIIKRVMEKDPMYPADITYPPAMIAAGIHVAVFKLGGATFEDISEKMPKHLSVPMDQIKGDARHVKLDVDLVTPENAEKYYFPESVF